MKMTIFEKLKAVKTKPELDALRPETVVAMEADGTQETFEKVQKAFIKARNKLLRIPLKDRTW
jgi:hypothetical protein